MARPPHITLILVAVLLAVFRGGHSSHNSTAPPPPPPHSATATHGEETISKPHEKVENVAISKENETENEPPSESEGVTKPNVTSSTFYQIGLNSNDCTNTSSSVARSLCADSHMNMNVQNIGKLIRAFDQEKLENERSDGAKNLPNYVNHGNAVHFQGHYHQPSLQYNPPNAQYNTPNTQYTTPDAQHTSNVPFSNPNVQYNPPNFQYNSHAQINSPDSQYTTNSNQKAANAQFNTPHNYYIPNSHLPNAQYTTPNNNAASSFYPSDFNMPTTQNWPPVPHSPFNVNHSQPPLLQGQVPHIPHNSKPGQKFPTNHSQPSTANNQTTSTQNNTATTQGISFTNQRLPATTHNQAPTILNQSPSHTQSPTPTQMSNANGQFPAMQNIPPTPQNQSPSHTQSPTPTQMFTENGKFPAMQIIPPTPQNQSPSHTQSPTPIQMFTANGQFQAMQHLPPSAQNQSPATHNIHPTNHDQPSTAQHQPSATPNNPGTSHANLPFGTVFLRDPEPGPGDEDKRINSKILPLGTLTHLASYLTRHRLQQQLQQQQHKLRNQLQEHKILEQMKKIYEQQLALERQEHLLRQHEGSIKEEKNKPKELNNQQQKTPPEQPHVQHYSQPTKNKPTPEKYHGGEGIIDPRTTLTDMDLNNDDPLNPTAIHEKGNMHTQESDSSKPGGGPKSGEPTDMAGILTNLQILTVLTNQGHFNHPNYYQSLPNSGGGNIAKFPPGSMPLSIQQSQSKNDGKIDQQIENIPLRQHSNMPQIHKGNVPPRQHSNRHQIHNQNLPPRQHSNTYQVPNSHPYSQSPQQLPPPHGHQTSIYQIQGRTKLSDFIRILHPDKSDAEQDSANPSQATQDSPSSLSPNQGSTHPYLPLQDSHQPALPTQDFPNPSSFFQDYSRPSLTNQNSPRPSVPVQDSLRPTLPTLQFPRPSIATQDSPRPSVPLHNSFPQQNSFLPLSVIINSPYPTQPNSDDTLPSFPDNTVQISSIDSGVIDKEDALGFSVFIPPEIQGTFTPTLNHDPSHISNSFPMLNLPEVSSPTLVHIPGQSPPSRLSQGITSDSILGNTDYDDNTGMRHIYDNQPQVAVQDQPTSFPGLEIDKIINQFAHQVSSPPQSQQYPPQYPVNPPTPETMPNINQLALLSQYLDDLKQSTLMNTDPSHSQEAVLAALLMSPGLPPAPPPHALPHNQPYVPALHGAHYLNILPPAIPPNPLASPPAIPDSALLDIPNIASDSGAISSASDCLKNRPCAIFASWLFATVSTFAFSIPVLVPFFGRRRRSLPTSSPPVLPSILLNTPKNEASTDYFQELLKWAGSNDPQVVDTATILLKYLHQNRDQLLMTTLHQTHLPASPNLLQNLTHTSPTLLLAQLRHLVSNTYNENEPTKKPTPLPHESLIRPKLTPPPSTSELKKPHHHPPHSSALSPVAALPSIPTPPATLPSQLPEGSSGYMAGWSGHNSNRPSQGQRRGEQKVPSFYRHLCQAVTGPDIPYSDPNTFIAQRCLILAHAGLLN